MTKPPVTYESIPIGIAGQLARALRSTEEEHPTHYKLGRGGRDPRRPTPADDDRLCDCSGAVNYWAGDDRLEIVDGKKVWYSCGGIIADALGPRRRWQLVDVPQVGDVMVYRALPPVRFFAHTGMITRIDRPFAPADPLWWKRWCGVTHCHGGNPGIIEETSAAPWLKAWGKARGTVFARRIRAA